MARGRGPGLTARPPVPAARLLLVATGVLALAVRLGPVIAAGALRGAMSYDEGVHLQVAQRLLAGRLTYRDVLFVHPPGVVLAQVPIAWLGGLVGEPDALAVSRCLVGVIGAVTAVLVARLLLPRGLLAAAAGGVVAALFSPAVASERVALLEPALSLGLVVALSAVAALARPGAAALDRPAPGGVVRASRRALAVGGIALGLATSVKVWALIDVVLVVALVALRHGRSAAWRWLAWSAVAFVVVAGPFAALAPSAMWHDVVSAQLHRPRQTGVSGAQIVGLMALVAVAALVLVTWRRTRFRSWSRIPALPDPAWWLVIGLVHAAALLAAPSHYLHYNAFLTVPVALCLGAGVGWAAGRAGRRASALGLGGVLVALVVTLVLMLPAVTPGARVSRALLDRAATGCVWVRDVQFLMVADLSRRQIEQGCPGQPDLFGLMMATDSDPDPAAALASLDTVVAGQLAASGTAFLRASNPLVDLGPVSRRYLLGHFAPGPTTGSIQVWRRSVPRGPSS
jgi:hypothetical protein